MDVVIGIYKDDRVIGWRVGTNPPDVLYEADHGYLSPAKTVLEHAGYRVVMVIEELNPTNILVMMEG